MPFLVEVWLRGNKSLPSVLIHRTSWSKSVISEKRAWPPVYSWAGTLQPRCGDNRFRRRRMTVRRSSAYVIAAPVPASCLPCPHWTYISSTLRPSCALTRR
nr:hypothetical protein CFP56_12108 [Quercus suber]